MSVKQQRHAAIREILMSAQGSTQEEIRSSLEARGITASQATLSRDLREMGAVKVHSEERGFTYRLGAMEAAGSSLHDMRAAVDAYCVELETVANFLIIKTTPSHAADFCLVLDRQHWQEIAGTLAGDDTILVVCRTGGDADLVQQRIQP